MYRSVHDDFEYYMYQIQGELTSMLWRNQIFYLFSIAGARRYLMKEPDSSIPACRRRMLKIMIVDRLLRVILFGFIFYKIFRKYNLFGFDDFVMGTRNETIIEKFWEPLKLLLCCLLFDLSYYYDNKILFKLTTKMFILLGVSSLKWAKCWWKLAFLSGIVFKICHQGYCLWNWALAISQHFEEIIFRIFFVTCLQIRHVF